MNRLVTSLSVEALKLSPEDRLRLVDTLLASVEPADADVEKSWNDEIAARIAAYERGESEMEDADAVLAEVRASLRR